MPKRKRSRASVSETAWPRKYNNREFQNLTDAYDYLARTKANAPKSSWWNCFNVVKDEDADTVHLECNDVNCKDPRDLRMVSMYL